MYTPESTLFTYIDVLPAIHVSALHCAPFTTPHAIQAITYVPISSISFPTQIVSNHNPPTHEGNSLTMINSAMHKISTAMTKVRSLRCSSFTKSLYKRANDQIDPECSTAGESFESLTSCKVKFASDMNFAQGRDSALYRRSAPNYKPGKWSYDFAAKFQGKAGSAKDDSRGWADTSFMMTTATTSSQLGSSRISKLPQSLREIDDKMASGAELDFLPDEQAGERKEGLIGLYLLCDRLFDAFAGQMLARHGSMVRRPCRTLRRSSRALMACSFSWRKMVVG
jgi:hypothetical protein